MSKMAEVVGGGLNVSKGLSVVGGVGAIATFFRVYSPVEYGEVGLRQRWKKPLVKNGEYVIERPGRHYTVPVASSIRSISLQDRTTGIGGFEFERKKQYRADGEFTWGIIDKPKAIHDALYVAQSPTELQQSVVRIFKRAFQETLYELDEEQIIEDLPAVYAGTEERSTDPLKRYGAELRGSFIMTARTLGQMISGRGLGVELAAVVPEVAGVVTNGSG